MLELSIVGTITKRLVLTKSTAAKPHDLATAEIVSVSFAIYNGKIPLDLKGPVVIDGDLGRHRIFFDEKAPRLAGLLIFYLEKYYCLRSVS